MDAWVTRYMVENICVLVYGKSQNQVCTYITVNQINVK